jgi:hypothetical protein
VTSAHETQHRLWAEQLGSLLDGKHGSRELTTEQTRRLMIAAYVVLRQHQVGKRGQCRLCCRCRSWWWARRRRTCTVYLTFEVAMNQPIDIVLEWLKDH